MPYVVWSPNATETVVWSPDASPTVVWSPYAIDEVGRPCGSHWEGVVSASLVRGGLSHSEAEVSEVPHSLGTLHRTASKVPFRKFSQWAGVRSQSQVETLNSHSISLARQSQLAVGERSEAEWLGSISQSHSNGLPSHSYVGSC